MTKHPDHFDEAHAFVARWEGGLSDHPSDPGGITKYGVSLRWLRALGHDLDGDGDIDADDIRALTPAQARTMFKAECWDKLGCDSLPRPVTLALYDGAVNQGAPRAVAQLQRACNDVMRRDGLDRRLDEDGALGRDTRAVLAELTDMGKAGDIARAMLAIRATFYRGLAQSRPGMSRFLNGWLARVQALAHIL